MIKFRIHIFGKIKSSELEVLAKYYLKLSSRYFSVDIIMHKDVGERKVRVSDIDEFKYVIVLSEKGKSYSSPELANKIQQLNMEQGAVDVILGNAYGIDSDLLEQAQMLLALSDLTLPHELAFVVFCEQLFRVGNILHGGNYHK